MNFDFDRRSRAAAAVAAVAAAAAAATVVAVVAAACGGGTEAAAVAVAAVAAVAVLRSSDQPGRIEGGAKETGDNRRRREARCLNRVPERFGELMLEAIVRLVDDRVA
jgi:fatty acid desaturase